MSSTRRCARRSRRPGRAGLTVVLVTGRILDQLRQVAGDLHFVDAVVAENGAVVHFPDSGYTTLLAPPLPVALAEACGLSAFSTTPANA